MHKILNLLKNAPTQLKHQLFALQLSLLISSVLEVAMIFIIATLFSMLFGQTPTENSTQFKFKDIITDGAFIPIIIISYATLVTNIFFMHKLIQKIGALLTTNMFEHYLSMDYQKFNTINQDEKINITLSESARLTNQIINPLLKLNSRTISIVVITVALLIYDLAATFSVITILIVIYFFMYRSIKYKVYENGKALSETNQNRIGFLQEAFTSIKNIKVNNEEDEFTEMYRAESNKFAEAAAYNNAIIESPRYAIEMVIITTISILGFYGLENYNNSNLFSLERTAIFGLAAMKLLPAVQQIYHSLATIRSNFFVVQTTADKYFSRAEHRRRSNLTRGTFQLIKINEVSFSYGDKTVINSLSTEILRGDLVGIVGKSGSGKTTLIDLIAGLLVPTSGTINILNSNGKATKPKIGYAAQSSIFRNISIKDAVTGSASQREYDPALYAKALKNSGLQDDLEGFPLGDETVLTNFGTNLSGGAKATCVFCKRVIFSS